EAYWNYLKRYPNGEHVAEAQEQLDRLSASRLPPPSFRASALDLPPGYFDEATGIAEVVPPGEAPPPVWGDEPPVFLRDRLNPRIIVTPDLRPVIVVPVPTFDPKPNNLPPVTPLPVPQRLCGVRGQPNCPPVSPSSTNTPPSVTPPVPSTTTPPSVTPPV